MKFWGVWSVFAGFMLMANMSYSQDTIYFKTGEEKLVKITEKSDKQVKYRFLDAKDTIIVIEDTKNIDKIIYNNGDVVLVSARSKRIPDRHGISAGMMMDLTGGSFFYKFHLNYFTKPSINYAIDVVKNTEDGGNGFFVGMRYYLHSVKLGIIKPYSGLSVGAMRKKVALQVPLGVSLAAKNGFDLKLGLNANYLPSDDVYDLFIELLAGCRLIKHATTHHSSHHK
ncbi:MAG: hypothetical protein GVY19_00825 [Bacteroidetes bacterium]|jgi:hypothetical protein|nr:hypothetical protein [Bacteroidota bacterium]